MAFFNWLPDYSVGITVVDLQHKALVDLTNTLARLKGRKISPINCVKLLNNAITYVDDHFSTEEDIMEARKFELSDSHKKEHSDFKNNVINVAKEFESTGKIDLNGLATYLREWIINHISKIDKQHFKIMKKAGLTDEIASIYNRPLQGFTVEISI